MAVVGARTRLLLSLLLLSAVLLTHTSAQLLAPAQRIFQREDQSGTFLQAVERCQAGGGALVSIRSLEEQAQANAIRRLLSPTATLWLGARVEACVFSWTTEMANPPLPALLSALLAPQATSKPQCTEAPVSFVQLGADGKWYSAKADEMAAAVLCERLICETGTYADLSTELCFPYLSCTALQFISRQPTLTSDRECTTLTDCAEDEFESEAPTPTSDRTCQKIRASCKPGFYEAMAPGPRQDRECRPWTNCTKAEYEVSAPNVTLDRVCTALTQCTDGFFERIPPTPSSDRLCFPDSCPPEEYHRFLSAHAADKYFVCTPYTDTCTPGNFAVKPPGRQEDTICTPIGFRPQVTTPIGLGAVSEALFSSIFLSNFSILGLDEAYVAVARQGVQSGTLIATIAGTTQDGTAARHVLDAEITLASIADIVASGPRAGVTLQHVSAPSAAFAAVDPVTGQISLRYSPTGQGTVQGGAVGAAILRVRIADDALEACYPGATPDLETQPVGCVRVVGVALLFGNYLACPSYSRRAAESDGTVRVGWSLPIFELPAMALVSPVAASNVTETLTGTAFTDLDIGLHSFTYYPAPLAQGLDAQLRCSFSVDVRQGGEIVSDTSGHLFVASTKVEDRLSVDYFVDTEGAFGGGATLPELNLSPLALDSFTLIIRSENGKSFGVPVAGGTRVSVQSYFAYCIGGEPFPADGEEQLVPMSASLYFNGILPEDQPPSTSGQDTARTVDGRCIRIATFSEPLKEGTLSYLSLAITVEPTPPPSSTSTVTATTSSTTTSSTTTSSTTTSSTTTSSTTTSSTTTSADAGVCFQMPEMPPLISFFTCELPAAAGQTCNAFCRMGMTQLGRNKFVCQPDGTWEGGCGLACANSVASNGLYTISRLLDLADATFTDADAQCAAVSGGRLAALRQRGDVLLAQLAAQPSASDPYWVGARRNTSRSLSGDDSGWHFVDGTPFNAGGSLYNPCPSGALCPWSAGQPDVGVDDSQNCALMGAADQSETGGWRAARCNERRPYLCRSPIPGRYEGPNCIAPGRRRRRNSTAPATLSYRSTGWGQVVVSTSPAPDAGNEVLLEDPGPLLLVVDTDPPIFFGCPADDIKVRAPQGSSRVSVTWKEPMAFDNVALDRITQTHQPGDNFTVAGSPHRVVYRAFDTSQLVTTCAFFVIVVFDEMQAPGATLMIGTSLLNARSVSRATSPDSRFSFMRSEDAIIHAGSSASRESVILSPPTVGGWSTTNTVRLTLSPSGGDAFGVQFRQLPFARGRFLVNLHFTATVKVNTTDEARLVSGLSYGSLSFENLRGLDDGRGRALSPDFFQTDLSATVVGLDARGHLTSLHLVGMTDSFDTQITFTSMTIALTYAGLELLGDAPLKLTDTSTLVFETFITVPGGVLGTASFLALEGGHLSIVDTIPPSFNGTCPKDIVLKAEPGRNDTAVSWILPTATDARGVVSLTGTASPGDRFTVVYPGEVPHRVVYTAIDSFGLQSQCIFTVDVRDAEAPTLACPPPVHIELSLQSAAQLTRDQVTPLSVSDNADPPAALSVSVPALVWPIGSHRIPIYATDRSGNTESCLLIADVIDVGVPVAVGCPLGGYSVSSVIGEPISVTWTVAFHDNDPRPLARSASHTSGDEFPVGITAVELRATDASNLTGICAFNVTVLNLASLIGEENGSGGDDEGVLSVGVIAGVAVAGSIIVVLLLTVFIISHRARARPHNFRRLLVQMKARGYDCSFDTSETGPLLPRELKRGNVKLVSPLGKGNFGDVSKGLLNEPGRPEFIVAVKRLLEDAEASARTELLQEAALMAQFSHAHVVGLVGVITVGEPLLVVIEYCEHSSLRSFLHTRAVPHFGKLSMSRDCADGLGYLSDRGFVHRDVAARNILVSSELKAKISDFGLSRDTGDNNYYHSTGGVVPVRWCAIESLEQRKYSTATDIWGFGVLLYEMWTDGAVPYKGWSNQKVWTQVVDGYRLPCPLNCDSDIHGMMQRCWEVTPTDRPSFAVLRIFFEKKMLELAPADDGASVVDGSKLWVMGTSRNSRESMWHTATSRSSGEIRRASTHNSWNPSTFNTGSSFRGSTSQASRKGSARSRDQLLHSSGSDAYQGEYMARGSYIQGRASVRGSVTSSGNGQFSLRRSTPEPQLESVPTTEAGYLDLGAATEVPALSRHASLRKSALESGRASVRSAASAGGGRPSPRPSTPEPQSVPVPTTEAGYLDLGATTEVATAVHRHASLRTPSLDLIPAALRTPLRDEEGYLDLGSARHVVSSSESLPAALETSGVESHARRPATSSRLRASCHGSWTPRKELSPIANTSRASPAVPWVAAAAAALMRTEAPSPAERRPESPSSSCASHASVRESRRSTRVASSVRAARRVSGSGRRSFGSLRYRAGSMDPNGSSDGSDGQHIGSRTAMRAMVEARIAAMVAATQGDGFGQWGKNGEEHDGAKPGRHGPLAHLSSLKSGTPLQACCKGSHPPPQYPASLEWRSQQPSPEFVKSEPGDHPLHSKSSAFAATAHDGLLVTMDGGRGLRKRELLNEEEEEKEREEVRVGDVENVTPCAPVEPASSQAGDSQSCEHGRHSVSAEAFCSDDGHHQVVQHTHQAPSHHAQFTPDLQQGLADDAVKAVSPRAPRQRFGRRSASELTRLEEDFEPPPTLTAFSRASGTPSLTLDTSGIASESSVV